MFNPIKKIFTYIQKNASGSNMFGNTNTNTADEEGVGSSSRDPVQQQEPEASKDWPSKAVVNDDEYGQEEDMEPVEEVEEEEFDIEKQIKTSIIDASKVHARVTEAAVVLPNLQLDDELADFANEPIELSAGGDDTLDDRFLELDNFPNNEIIVLNDADLNSSLASDNVSEDPLAIDDFTQPLARDSDNVLDSSSVTTNEEADTSGDLIWLKLAPDADEQRPRSSIEDQDHIEPKHVKTKEDELRSDGGSDSGLGSETSTVTGNQVTTSSSNAVTAERTSKPTGDLEQAVSSSARQPLRSNLKRRLDEADGMDLTLVAELRAGCPSSTLQKRQKRSINFDNVKVYYFPRQQGFTCVPTAGGCTLGMGARHIAAKTMTLAEHAAELRRAHRNQNPDVQPRGSSSDDTEESEEDYLSEGSDSDADGDSNGFLQPVTPKQRRALLKAAGVRKIDAGEKIECRDIRNSREVCGCSCREFCDPETCACSQAGIKCQVDRAMFPCGCTREACGNTVGRVEFNPTRVRTHYIHTVMRMDLEQRQGQSPTSLAYGSNSSAASVSHCYFMQTQSNYSSGYASPAYTPESSVNYYQQQAAPQSTAAQQHQIEQQTSYGTHPDLQYPLDSLDASLFASGSNATPSYGELLAPTYHSLSYGSAAQLSPYNAYHGQQSSGPTTAAGPVARSAFSSCAVPSAPPYGNATTTASNAQYHHAIVLETTASMTATTTFLAAAPTATATCAFSSARDAADFISLNTPVSSSSRLSQINDLLQHNRNTTAALVAVSESPGYTAVRTATAPGNSSNLDSIDTPPIEDAQRSCMTFEELPPPLVNPTPIVAVLEQRKTSTKLSVSSPAAPQPRQPLDVCIAVDRASE